MRYQTIAFVQGEDYDEIADMGVQEMADHLRQWDYGDEIESRYSPPWGESDRLYQIDDGEVLAVNHGCGYASLTYVHSR
jgi:hypothetical protein